MKLLYDVKLWSENGCILGDILPTTYSLCEEKSLERWSRTKGGNYGKGLANTKEDPAKVERVGLLGEVIIGSMFNEEVDFEYRHGGDGKVDFNLNGYKIDVKCSMRDFGAGLIYAVNDYGKNVPTCSDIFCFSHVVSEDKANKKATIKLVGWCFKEDIERKPLVLGRKRGSKHYNREIKYEELNKFSQEELNKILSTYY